MTMHYSLLDEPLIGARLRETGARARYTLPGLFVALAEDSVRDFPALRPHQRHPWHAFLVQLAAMALHHAGQTEPFKTEEEWRQALLALTPDDTDGAAWCLVSPHDSPAFMQAPVPGGDVSGWSDDTPTPDSLDILVTSKNHDVKQQRARSGEAEDWVFALVSLQTAAPYGGSGNHRIARMNGGYSSRVGVGIEPVGGPGRRWARDIRIARTERSRLVEEFGYRESEGIGLIWLLRWDGLESLPFLALDPFFIEISRRVRLVNAAGKRLKALRSTSKTPRLDKEQSVNGNTGDLWVPISAGKALHVRENGFNYSRVAELLFDNTYQRPPAQIARSDDDMEGLVVIARGIAGGNCTTDGYHERRIPISRKAVKRLIQRDTDGLATAARARTDAIRHIRNLLRQSLETLFDNARERKSHKDVPNSIKQKANSFAKSFELGEDARFFTGPDGLNEEIDSNDREEVFRRWIVAMANRAEKILTDAFDAGPRSGEQRYRARASALDRFRGGLHSDKVLPDLAGYFRTQQTYKEADRELA